MVLTGYSDPLECSVGLELPLLRLTWADVTPFIQVYDSSDGSGTPRRATALTGASAPYVVIKSVYTLLGFVHSVCLSVCHSFFLSVVRSIYSVCQKKKYFF